MIISNWTKGLWTAGPPCSAPANTLTRLTNMQVMDEGVIQTRPGATLQLALGSTSDGVYISGLHFYKTAAGAVYQGTTSLGFTQTGTDLRVAAMVPYGLLYPIVFFPRCMKKYDTDTGTVSNWGISVIPSTPGSIAGIAGNLSGTYTYKLAFYNSTNKTLGPLSAASLTLAVVSKEVNLYDIPTTCTDPQVDQVRIYRTTGTITSTWKYVDYVILGTSTYTDNVADAGLGDAADLYYIAPPTANVAARYKSNMLLLDVPSFPSYCYASIGSTPEGFLSNVYELVSEAGDTVLAAAPIGDYLYVFGQQYVYNVQIDTSGNLQVSKLPTGTGAINGRTVSMGGQGLYYASSDGIYVFQGFTPMLISESIDALFRGIDRGGLSTISSWDTVSGTFVGGRYHFTYYGADSVWHTLVFNERKNRWKHYTGWRFTVFPGPGAYPYVGLSDCIAQSGAQGVYLDNTTAYTSECGFNIQMPMTELNEVRGFRLSAQCSGTLTVSFYDTDTLMYSVDLVNVSFTDGWVKHSLPNGTYFADPEVRISSTSPFTLRMFEPTVIPVRKQVGDYTRVQQLSQGA